MDLFSLPSETLVAILALVGFVTFGTWSKFKKDTSIYKGSTSADDVVFAKLSNVGEGKAIHHIDGRIELRPPVGYRILAPLGGLVLIALVDWDTILHDVGLTNETHQLIAKLVFAGAMLFALFELNFRQRVVYDQHEISSLCATLTMQTRRLDTLLEIGHHPKQNFLVFGFSDQPNLHVPKFLANRDAFLADMEAIAAANRAKGDHVRKEGFA